MIHLIILIALIAAVLYAAKSFYRAADQAQHPERYPASSGEKYSKKELGMVMAHLQRWRNEGKISREEYDHLTDLCLSDMGQG